MATRGATLLGINPGDIGVTDKDDDVTTSPEDFSRALSILKVDPASISSTEDKEGGGKKVRIFPRMLDKAPPTVAKAVDYANQVTEGVPILSPLADKAAAAVKAIKETIAPSEPNEYGNSFSERYGNALSQIQNRSKNFQQENPVGSAVANVTGAVASGIPQAIVAPWSMGLRGPSVAWRALGGGLGGGAIGGTDAALRGENALTGTGIGAAGGVLGPLIGEGAHRATSAALNYFVPKQGMLRNVDPINVNRLTNAIEGETPATIAAGRDKMGSAGFLGDLNQGMTDLTGAAAVTPGPGKAIVRDAYTGRADQQLPRVEAAVTRAMGPPMDQVALDKMTTEARKAAADPLYAQWRSMQVHPTPELQDLIPRLKSAGAFTRARQLAAISGEPLEKNFFVAGPKESFPTTQTWDYVKQGLDSGIDKAYNKGDKTLAAKLIGLKHELIDEIRKTDAGKVWDQARGTFADHSALLDQRAAGRDTFLGGRSGTSVDELRHELKGLAAPELQARIQGARAAISEALGASVNGDTIMRNKLLAPNNQEKLKLLIGDDTVSGKLIKELEQEAHLGNKTMDVLGNNATGASNVGRAERKNMLMPEPARKWDVDFQKPATWIPPSIRDQFTIHGMIDARRADKHSVANNQLAYLLTHPDGPAMVQLIDALRNESARQGQRYARTQAGGNALTGLIAGPGSSVVRRQVLPTQ